MTDLIRKKLNGNMMAGLLSKQESGHIRLGILVATIFVCMAPFIATKVGKTFNIWLANGALASPYMSGELIKPDISPEQRAKYVATMQDLLGSNPDVLDKLVQSDLEHIFNAPALVRQDGPMTIWQYQAKSCVVDVYFSNGTGQASDLVIHKEFRTRQTAYLVNAEEKAAPLHIESNEAKASCIEDIFKAVDATIVAASL